MRREYGAARTAGTLNGADWNAYRVACADRLKAASATPSIPSAPSAAASVAETAIAPAATAIPTPAIAPSSGMAAMHARQKSCGAEWTAAKATLVAQTPA